MTNENVKIKIFASSKKAKSYDDRDERKIIDTFKDQVLPSMTRDYHSVSIKVKRKSDNSPDFLIGYLMRSDSYTADIIKVDLDDNYQVKSLKEDFDDQLDLDDEDVMDTFETFDASEIIDFIVATPVPEIPSAKKAVEAIHKMALDAGLKSKILLGNEANIGNYKHYLLAKIKGFVNIGHGYTGGIVLDDGRLRYSWFNSLSNGSLAPAVVYFNSCQVFNNPLQPSIMQSGARTFIGGIINLLIGSSEEVCKCFWKNSLDNSELMNNALRHCEKDNYPKINAHGISGDLGMFKAEKQIGIRAVNNRFVCAINGGDSYLESNRTWIRGWETFRLVQLGNDKVALQASNGKYISAEGGGGRELIANRPWIRGWETFKLHKLRGNKFALQAYNGQYVCAENAGRGKLMANRNAIASWETFELITLNHIALKANNNKFVCAEHGGGRELVANRTWLRSWETFTLADFGDNKVALQSYSGKYVCADLAGVQPLIANRNWIQGWETFTMHKDGHNVAFQACNGKYICANGEQDLIASSDIQLDNETFQLFIIDGNLTLEAEAHREEFYMEDTH
jgi:hypothetical protein